MKHSYLQACHAAQGKKAGQYRRKEAPKAPWNLLNRGRIVPETEKKDTHHLTVPVTLSAMKSLVAEWLAPGAGAKALTAVINNGNTAAIFMVSNRNGSVILNSRSSN